MAATSGKKPASKSAGTRTSSSPKPASRSSPKSTSGRSGASGKGRGNTKSAARPAKRRRSNRNGQIFLLLMLALFSLIGCFTAEGWFIWFFREFMQGLIGKGFYFVPAALLFSALVMAMVRDRPVRGRIACSLALTVVIGVIIHLFCCRTAYTWSWGLPGELYRDGTIPGADGSGGMIGGLITMACLGLFNKVGASVVLVLSFVFLLLGAFNITPITVLEWYRNRPVREYDYDDDYDDDYREPEHPATSAPAPQRSKRAVIDVPMDDAPARKRGRDDASFGAEPDSDRIAQVLTRKKAPAPVPLVKAEAPVSASSVRVETPALMPLGKTEAPAPAEIIPADKPGAPAFTDEQLQKSIADEKNARAADEMEKKIVAGEVAASIEKSLADTEEIKYVYPPMELLSGSSPTASTDGREETSVNAKRLSATIKSFGIPAEICSITRGPTVTRYEVELEQGVKLNRLTNLSDDIALALGASGVRIAPVPDRISIVGIEVPNKLTNTVYLRDVIDTDEFKNNPSKISFAIGKDIGANPVVGDIAKLPHMLIAGTTGSGKSVCMNSLILSLLYKASPEQVRLIMIDPKMVELGIYNGIPHLLIPVVTDPKKAAGALQWSVMEMMKRNRMLADAGARDIASYNKIMEKTEGGQKLPQIVVLIDELADLMLVAGKDVEESICRIAAVGRAAGIHLVIATQRPSADVITGLMKANIPSRIAFSVDSALNSRIILDTTGAEKLVGKGDMLYSPVGVGKPVRIQGTFVTDAEREDVINFVKEQGLANYSKEIQDEIERNADKDSKKGEAQQSEPAGAGRSDDTDEMFSAAVEVILESGQASVSMLQRRLKLGYSRAARLVDQMEDKGIVGPFEGSKPRALLITREKWNEMQGLVTAAPETDTDNVELENTAVDTDADDGV